MRIFERPREAGFTLIELLVVVAVIALLTAFALPRVIGALHDSRKVIGQGDLHTLETALERYHLDDEHGGRYPALAVVEGPEDQDQGEDAVWFRSELAEYLRPNALLTNGYYTGNLTAGAGQGYIYASDAEGSYYLLVDPGNASSVSIACLGGSSISVTGNFKAVYAPRPADMASCTPPPKGAIITN